MLPTLKILNFFSLMTKYKFDLSHLCQTKATFNRCINPWWCDVIMKVPLIANSNWPYIKTQWCYLKTILKHSLKILYIFSGTPPTSGSSAGGESELSANSADPASVAAALKDIKMAIQATRVLQHQVTLRGHAQMMSHNLKDFFWELVMLICGYLTYLNNWEISSDEIF